MNLTDTKILFLNKEIRSGGCYELCIQVSPTLNTIPLKAYNEFFWNLGNVAGPYDYQFETITVDIENSIHEGILTIDNKQLPFRQCNIREEDPAETGFNWFDISFHTSTIEHVFQLNPQHWSEDPKVPKPLLKFLHDTMLQLFKLHPFEMAIIDFEISGEYYLHDLKNELNNWTNSKFFLSQQHYDEIKQENKQFVTVVD